LAGWQDGVLVHGQDDQRLCAFGDQAVNVTQLHLRRATRISADVLGARLFQLSLDGGFVGFSALFLKVGPVHAHGLGEHAAAAKLNVNAVNVVFSFIDVSC
jgi:hypothetical protein